MTAMTFEREQLIRFSHCDPAAIVFFPRYFVMFNNHVEDWFDDGLKLGYAHVVAERRIGLPTVSIRCDFSRPSRMGERVHLGLAVERLGRSSITLALECRHGNELRVRAQQVIVTQSLESGHAVPIPEDIRAAMATFQRGVPS